MLHCYHIIQRILDFAYLHVHELGSLSSKSYIFHDTKKRNHKRHITKICASSQWIFFATFVPGLIMYWETHNISHISCLPMKKKSIETRGHSLQSLQLDEYKYSPHISRWFFLANYEESRTKILTFHSERFYLQINSYIFYMRIYGSNRHNFWS